MSVAPSGASSSPNSAMVQSLIASHPRSMTWSANTRRALARIRSEYVAVMAPSRSCGKAGDIDDGIGDAVADIGIVHDGDDAGAAALALGDQIDHVCGIGGIERGGWLVEQQDRQIRQQAPRDVNALLFAAGERRRGKRPQSLRDIKAAEQVAR